MASVEACSRGDLRGRPLMSSKKVSCLVVVVAVCGVEKKGEGIENNEGENG